MTASSPGDGVQGGPVTGQATGPGGDLKSAREGMGVSVREVADALNLPARVIESLEADDYERLQPSVFTRGYLRSYARLLELNPDELLARYPEVTEEVEVVPEEMASPVRGARVRLIGVAVVGAVLLLLLLAWLLSGGDEAPPAAEPPAETAPEQVSGVDSADESQVPSATRDAMSGAAGEVEAPRTQSEPAPPVSAVETNVESTGPELTEEQTTPPAQTSRVPEAVAAEREPAQASPPVGTGTASVSDVDAAPVVAGERRERRITEFGDDELLFVFSEDCWVEVKSLDGENLYSDLNRAGQTLVLTGRGPFRVLLGYAPGVRLDFNGDPVDLPRFSRNNVASLVLGQ